MRPFDFEPTGNGLLDRLVERLRDVFASLGRPVTNDNLVSVTLGTGPTQVFHGLGEIPRAWEVVGRDAGEVVYEPAIVNGARMRYLYLQATGPVTVTLRFS